MTAKRKPEETDIRAVADNATQPGKQIAHSLDLKEISVLHFEGNGPCPEFLRQPLGMRVTAEEHSAIAPPRPAIVQLEDPLGNIGALLAIFLVGNDLYGFIHEQQSGTAPRVVGIARGLQLLAIKG